MTIRCASCAGPLYACDRGFSTCVECERKRLGDAVASKRAALSAVDAATPDAEKARIEAAILKVAGSGRTFSANDVRPLLKGIPGQRIGPRFGVLARRGLIRHVGYLPSTKGNTHGHDIKTWARAS